MNVLGRVVYTVNKSGTFSRQMVAATAMLLVSIYNSSVSLGLAGVILGTSAIVWHSTIELLVWEGRERVAK